MGTDEGVMVEQESQWKLGPKTGERCTMLRVLKSQVAREKVRDFVKGFLWSKI